MQKRIKSFDGVFINYNISRVSKNFLIFLHGAGGDLGAWKKEREFFRKKGISTLGVDLRGHGLSERPTSLEDYKLDNFARDVYFVIKKEKIHNFVLVGHCFGGIVAIMFHKLYPALSKGYVLVDTTFKAPDKLKMILNHSFLAHVLNHLLRNNELHKKNFAHVNFDRFVGTGDWNLKRIYSDIIHTSFKSWLFTYENMANFDGANTLKHIDKNVLIIEGEKDSIFDILVAKKIKRLIKTSKLDIIPKENHIIVINNPDAVEQEILKFASSLKNFLKK